jgi:hypothetical protein
MVTIEDSGVPISGLSLNIAIDLPMRAITFSAADGLRSSSAI